MNIAPVRSFNYPKQIFKNDTAATIKRLQNNIYVSFKGNNLSDKISLIPSNAPDNLEKNIENKLGINFADTTTSKFKDGEIYTNIKDKVRNKDVYIMPGASSNVNDNIMEVFLKTDAAKRAGAKKVVAIMPYFSYSRQEKKMEAGEPIAAKLHMDLLERSGVDEIITTDLHSPAIEGFSSNNLIVNHINAADIIKDYIKQMEIPDLVIVSPDSGGMKRADRLAVSLGNVGTAGIYKNRTAHNVAEAKFLAGDVKDKNCIIYDDIIDTAGTIAAAANMLKENGAKDIYVFATHGLFNGDAFTKLENAPIKEVYVTNSVRRKSDCPEKIKQIDISPEITGTILDISG